jgi:ribosome production factor 1
MLLLRKIKKFKIPTQIQAEEANDEFASYFGGKPPRVLLTTANKPSKTLYRFMREFLHVMPKYCTFYERMGHEIKDIVEYAKNRAFTAIIMINEDQ